MEPINKKLGFRQINIVKENNALTFNLFELNKNIKFKLETNGNLIPIGSAKPLNISELRAKAIFTDLNENHPFISDLFNMPKWDINKIAVKMNENWKMTELQKRFKELGAGSDILQNWEQSKKSMEK